MALVILPYMYIPDPTRGRPVFNGKIYIGEVDTDPRIESNQKAALLVQEDGSRVEAEYPIQINSGGVPTYNGSPVAIDVTGEYAIAIDSKDDQQVYYVARAGTDAENLTTDLRSVMFDFGLLYEDIGSTLVSSSAGTLLDEARLILDINSGRVLDLPTSIPTGSVVVSLTDFTLVTNNGQFTLNQAWSNTVENRIKGQQNWNIPDPSGDPLISATPTTYTVGEFPAVNVEVVNANAVNLRKDGDLIKGDSGTLRHCARGAYRAGVIDETTEYMGIKDHLGNQLEAGVTPGVTKGNNGVDLYVDVDITQLPGGYHFAGISAERGLWPEVSDDEAEFAFRGYLLLNTAPNVEAEFYRDGKIVVRGSATLNQQVVTNVNIGIDTNGLSLISASVVAQDSTGVSSYRTSLANSPSLSGNNLQLVSTWSGNNIPVKFEVTLK